MYRRKKKKGNIIILVCVVLALGALSYGYFMNNQDPKKPIVDIKNPQDNQVTDSTVVNSDGDVGSDLSNRVGKEALLVFNTYYVKTGEILTKEDKIPQEVVGKTLSEFKDYIETKYENYTIRSISADNAKLFRQVNGYNPNYHVIKSDEEKILIYIVNEDGGYDFLDDTGLTTANLGKADRDKLREGIVVKTIDEVYNIIEDFSS